jgi:ParB/RepB/Spo0J family partition protein
MTTATDAAQTTWIDLNLIDLPADARTHDPEKLESLTQDMAAGGQLQEIVVSRNGDRYQVLAGVGRTLAARKLGWDKVRCLIKEGLSDFDKARITYAENEEREDADPFYQALQLQKMMKAKEWSQNRMAQNLGQARRNIQIYMSLFSLDPKVAEVARRLATPIGQLTELMRLTNLQDQIKLAQECHDKDLSVRQLKALVDKKVGNVPKAEKAVKPQGDLAWTGEEIAINRHYKPAHESAQDYVAWLVVALQAFAETKPVSKYRHPDKAAADSAEASQGSN